MDDAVEPFGRDDVELSADDVFESDDDDELSEPDELDFEINDLVPADEDDEDVDDEYAVLFELNRTIVNVECAKNMCSILMLNRFNTWLIGCWIPSSPEKWAVSANHSNLLKLLRTVTIGVMCAVFWMRVHCSRRALSRCAFLANSSHFHWS